MPQTASAQDSATYTFTFEGNWNLRSAPKGVPSNAYFTAIIWRTHDSGITYWKPGGMASRGVEVVAEDGATHIFADETIAEGARDHLGTGDVFGVPRGGNTRGSTKIRFRSKKYPRLTFLSMLGPTPDWFVGVSGISLLDSKGNWVRSKTMSLYAYDAGTEEGSEYTQNNPASNPHVPIFSLKGKGKFSGSSVPVARIRLELDVPPNPVNLKVGGKTAAVIGEGGALDITAALNSVNDSGGALAIPIRVRSNGSTAGSNDYTLGAASVAIADNARTGTVKFTANDDGADEPPEKVIVELGSSLPKGVTAGSGNTVTITIADDDATVVSLARTDSGAIAEGGTGARENAEFTVSLGRALAAGERIDVPLVFSGAGITSADLEALALKSGSHLNTGVTLSGAGTLTPVIRFQGANARTATLELTPADDDEVEGNESLRVALGPDGSGTNGFDRSALGTNVGGGSDPHKTSNSFNLILESDDDPPPSTPVVSIAGGSAVTEGGTATFTLSASPKPPAGITVRVTVTDSGAFAGSGQSGTRTLAMGTGGTAVLTVTTLNDEIDEENGSITATVAAGDGYSPSNTKGTATVAVSDDDLPLPVASFSSSSQSAGENAGTRNVRVNLSRTPASGFTLNYSVKGTAVSGVDYTALPGSVSVSSGAASVDIPVKITDDGADEGSETVLLTLTAGEGYEVGSTNVHTLTIEDNDDPPPSTPVVSIAGGSAVTEGGTATFTLSASPKPPAGITVRVTVTDSGAFAGSGQSGTRTLAMGTGGTAVLTVTTLNDEIDEENGSITATVAAGDGYSPSNTKGTATVAVSDDDLPLPVASFSSSSQSAGENAGTRNVRVNLSRTPASGFTLNYSVKGTAVSGVDYTALPGSVSVSSGAASVDIPVKITDDGTDEGSETVLLTLTAGEGYEVGSTNVHTLTIEDNDDPPPSTPVVSIAGGSAVTEGGTATFTLSASPKPPAGITVRVTVTDSGAFAGSGQSGTRTLAMGTGGTAVLTVTTLNDEIDEENGSITATVAAGDGYSPSNTKGTATVAVSDDDLPLPVASFSSSSQSAGENAGTRNVRVNLSRTPASGFTLNYSVKGTAVSGVDYTALPGSVSVSSGAASVDIPVKITDDGADEGSETVLLTLTAGEGYEVGSTNVHTLTIEDNDDPPPSTPVVSIAGGSAVTEGGTATFTLSASPKPPAGITVRVTVTDSGAFAGSGQSGTRTLAMGTGGTAVLTVTTLNDEIDEENGSITATVAAGDGYSPSNTKGTATVAVSDDDLPLPVASFSSSSVALQIGTLPEGGLSLDEGDSASYTLVLTAQPTDPVRVTPESAHPEAVSVRPAWLEFTPDNWDAPQNVTLTAVVDGDAQDESVVVSHAVSSADARYGGLDGGTVRVSVSDASGPQFVSTHFAFTIAENTVGPTPVRGAGGSPGAVRATGNGVRYTMAGGGELFLVDAETGAVTYTGSGEPTGRHELTILASDALGRVARTRVSVRVIEDPSSVAAGLLRIARTGADHVLEGIASRLEAVRRLGIEVRLAGQDILALEGNDGTSSLASAINSAHGRRGERMEARSVGRALSEEELLRGVAFALSGDMTPGGASWSAWGRGTGSRFDEQEGERSMQGEVLTGIVGLDRREGRWLTGLVVSRSAGEGEWSGPGNERWQMETDLTILAPYTAFSLSDPVTLWGTVGYGRGSLGVKRPGGGSSETDVDTTLLAAGVRGELIEAPPGGGFGLAVKSDVLWLRANSDEENGLSATSQDATRSRLALVASWRGRFEGYGELGMKLELGGRHEGDDAESGFGVEAGVAVNWSDQRRGIGIQVEGRVLTLHDAFDTSEEGLSVSLSWMPGGTSPLGPSIAFRLDRGAPSPGGLDRLAASGTGTASDEATGRAYSFEAAWGFPAFGGRFVGSPYIRHGFSSAANDYTFGWRLAPAAPEAFDLTLGVQATMSENGDENPDHGVGLELRKTW